MLRVLLSALASVELIATTRVAAAPKSRRIFIVLPRKCCARRMSSDVNLLLCGAPRPLHAHRSVRYDISGVLILRPSHCSGLCPALCETSGKPETTSHRQLALLCDTRLIPRPNFACLNHAAPLGRDKSGEDARLCSPD